MRRTSALLAVALAAVAVGACGGSSKQDQAQQTVCSARADIRKQVDKLSTLSLTTATLDQVTTSLTAIGDDLKKITDAQGDLSDQRRKEVEAANQAFASQVRSTLSAVGTSLSLSQARTQLESAIRQLATSYQQTFAQVDCSGGS